MEFFLVFSSLNVRHGQKNDKDLIFIASCTRVQGLMQLQLVKLLGFKER